MKERANAPSQLRAVGAAPRRHEALPSQAILIELDAPIQLKFAYGLTTCAPAAGGQEGKQGGKPQRHARRTAR